MNKRKKLAITVLLFAICVMIYAGIQLVKIEKVYRVGDAHYDGLKAQVRQVGRYAPDIMPRENQQYIYIPEMEIDFTELRKLSEGAIAWLYSPNTAIDYPVMQSVDYSYYVDHLPNGTRNANGSLFLDFNCAPDFSGELTVIYGHNMKSGKMFGSLTGYKRQEYYDKHPYMYLYTEHGNYRIDLLYGCVIAAGQWRDRAFMYAENLSALLAFAEYNTTFTSSVKYSEGEKVIVLSTCSYEFDDARYIVIGVLR